ncbi:MAG TPA: MFS transporter [Chloroflexota bacterium]
MTASVGVDSAGPPGIKLGRDFAKLWAGQSVSLIGSEVSLLAMPLLAVLVLGASPGEMGVLRAVQFAPELLALPVGVLVDRIKRRPLLIGVDLLRALLLGSIPLAALLGVLAMAQLYVVAVLIGALTLVFGVAYMAYLPALVPSTRLIEANSRLEVSRSGAHAAGPGVAGLIVQTLSASAAILFDALSFAVSAVCLWWIRQAEPDPMPRTARQQWWTEIKEGLREVVQQPILRAMTLSSMAWNFFSGGLLDAIYVLYLSRELQMSAGQIAMVFTTSGVAGLAGAVIWTRIARRAGLGRSIIAAQVLACVGTLAVPFVNGSPDQVTLMLIGVILIIGFAMPMSFIGLGSLRQAYSPPHLIGRISASTRFLLIGVVPAGALLGGALGDAIGPRNALLVAGIGVLLAPVPLVLSPVRSVRTL